VRDVGTGFPWWRWLAAFWALLAVVALIAGDWGGLGMALVFATGLLVHELRSRQRTEARAVTGRLVALGLALAALGAGGVYLLLRFQFHVSPAWWVTLLVFAGLALLYVGGPPLASVAGHELRQRRQRSDHQA
jgi:hypothetical protein